MPSNLQGQFKSDLVISTFRVDFQNNDGIIAATALLLYEILLTYDHELNSIWRRKFSAVTALFLCIRYGTLISQVAYLAFSLLPEMSPACGVMGYLYSLLNVLSHIASSAFECLRIWAIWNHHWLVLLLVIPTSLFPMVLDAYVAISERPLMLALPTPLEGCSLNIPLSIDAYTHSTVAELVFGIVTDTIVVVATIMKTWSIHRSLPGINTDGERSNPSLSRLVLRDGTVYFVVLLGVNITAIVFSLTPKFFSFNIVGIFVRPIRAMLLCRLILNLRSYNTAGTTTYTADGRQISSVRFATALGNIGAPLSMGSSEDWEDGDDYTTTGSSDVETHEPHGAASEDTLVV